MQNIEDHSIFRVISKKNYKRHRCDTCNKDYQNIESALVDHPNFPIHKIKIKSKILEIHKIIKILNRKSARFLCDNCNTGYSTMKMVIEDHLEYELVDFSVYDKTIQKTIQSVRVSPKDLTHNTFSRNSPKKRIYEVITH